MLRSVVAIAVVVAVLGLTGIGGILAVAKLRWSLVAQVVAFERLPAWAALGRSARLVRGGWWRTASLVTFVGGVALLLGPLTGTALLFVSSASFRPRQPGLERGVRVCAAVRRHRDHLPVFRPPSHGRG
ncbi:MAG: hypothetical protein U0Y82_05470 [Thermoleophilia bacterium]